MKALILGASGLVGGNCLRHFEESGATCLGTHFSYATDTTIYFNTLNLKDPNNGAIIDFAPDVIIHCGALTWVDYCEEHPEESYEKTVRSTENAVALAKELNAKLVYLSTDYVFDGKRGYYVEEDAVNPLSIYGKHKLEAEGIVQRLPNHLICRITNVYGHEERGKNFIARLVSNMQKGEQMDMKLPIDQYATPVNAYDVARAIYLLLNDGHSGIFHFAGTDYLNRVQLAERVIRYFGHEQVSLSSVTTAELNPPADRPLNGGMSAAKFNALYPYFGWSNVDDYLQHLNETSTHE
jgi:dTDP-4-dehydrorhamnose reductase